MDEHFTWKWNYTVSYSSLPLPLIHKYVVLDSSLSRLLIKKKKLKITYLEKKNSRTCCRKKKVEEERKKTTVKTKARNSKSKRIAQMPTNYLIYIVFSPLCPFMHFSRLASSVWPILGKNPFGEKKKKEKMNLSLASGYCQYIFSSEKLALHWKFH